MKALKSDLAQEILSNPAASNQLRIYLARKSARNAAPTPTESPDDTVQIELHGVHGGSRRFVPVVVPKAA